MDGTSNHNHAAAATTVVAGFPALHRRPSKAQGAAAPVLFLHGAFADEHCFAGWVQQFAEEGYEAYAPARRGRHGVGPTDAAGLTFDDYLADTNQVIDELGEAPIVVGHSLGGLLAQRLAEQGRTRAIVLIASAPPGVLTAQAVALPRFLPKMARIMTGRPFVVGNDACSVLALNAVPEDERPAILAHLTAESGRVYRSLLLGTIRIDASKVSVPVFVAGGDQDRIISNRLLVNTARRYHAAPHVYPGHGHWIIQEPGWETLARDILTWLRGLHLSTGSHSQIMTDAQR
ncbi:MAG: alpha/beta hydrolase [Vicinamibacterales bacterium]|jgi:pimeloyl-ACP methyl ester carboxylesterase